MPRSMSKAGKGGGEGPFRGFGVVLRDAGAFVVHRAEAELGRHVAEVGRDTIPAAGSGGRQERSGVSREPRQANQKSVAWHKWRWTDALVRKRSLVGCSESDRCRLR